MEQKTPIETMLEWMALQEKQNMNLLQMIENLAERVKDLEAQ